MFNYSKDGITVASILDNRRKTIKDTYPVKIRVTYKRDRKYYSTGKELSTEEWRKLPESKARKIVEIREDIENSFSIVKAGVESLVSKSEFSFDALNLRLGKAVGDTLNSALKAKIEKLKSEERIGTMIYYQSVLKGVELFADTKIEFGDITVDWLNRYEKFMLLNKNHTSVGFHMRGIRTMVGYARKAGIIKESAYPFGRDKYIIPTGEAKKKALNLEQIAAISKFTDGLEATERYRDLWFFMYLCNGINVADLVKLQYKNIMDGEICFVRQKTERTTKSRREIRAVVTPQMQTIIERWGSKSRQKYDYIFPFLTGQEDAMRRKTITTELTKRINMRMKKIGTALGIEGISTYTARHSYATVLKRSGANIAYISESLGHNDLKTTEAYLAGFEKEERQKNASLLTAFYN